jgi:hypothetical protein
MRADHCTRTETRAGSHRICTGEPVTDELDRLRAEAQEIDAAGLPQTTEGAAPEGAAPSDIPPPPSNANAIAFLAAAFREVGGMILGVQSLKVTLAEPVCAQLGDALAPVADHYGISLGGMIGGVWGQALFVAGPIVANVYQGLGAELKAKAAANDQPRQIPSPEAPAPAQETKAEKLIPAKEAAEFSE